MQEKKPETDGVMRMCIVTACLRSIKCMPHGHQGMSNRRSKQGKKKKEENPTGSSGLRATTPCKNTLSPAEDLKMYATFAAAVAAHM